MTFIVHIDIIAFEALKMAGFIQRNTVDSSGRFFKLLYCSLVRSLLEYGTPVSSPSYGIT